MASAAAEHGSGVCDGGNGAERIAGITSPGRLRGSSHVLPIRTIPPCRLRYSLHRANTYIRGFESTRAILQTVVVVGLTRTPHTKTPRQAETKDIELSGETTFALRVFTPGGRSGLIGYYYRRWVMGRNVNVDGVFFQPALRGGASHVLLLLGGY